MVSCTYASVISISSSIFAGLMVMTNTQSMEYKDMRRNRQRLAIYEVMQPRTTETRWNWGWFPVPEHSLFVLFSMQRVCVRESVVLCISLRSTETLHAAWRWPLMSSTDSGCVFTLWSLVLEMLSSCPFTSVEYMYRMGQKTGLFLRVDNFTSVGVWRRVISQKFPKFCLEKSIN